MADTVELIVTKLSKKGEGIAFYQDWEVYIPQVLLGEKLQVELGEPFVQGSARRPGKVVQILIFYSFFHYIYLISTNSRM